MLEQGEFEQMGTATATVNKAIKFTYADYLVYPSNGNQLQLIEGEFYMTPAPNIFHQDIAGNLYAPLRQFVLEHHLGKVYEAPTDVVLSDTNTVQPDILFIRKQRVHVLRKNYVKGAPDLVVEILSERTKKMDMSAKRKLYAKYGVIEYWIVDPDKKTVEVLSLGSKGYQSSGIYRIGQTLTSSVLPGLKISVADVFKK